jgi:CubicO group peptidase (beta-lactamase class C family)
LAVVAVAVLLLLYSPDIAPERYADLATFFRVEMKRQGYSGFSVAAVADGSVLYVDGFGEDGAGNAIGPDTPLYAPAFAESLAALSAYSLALQGRLSLDAPLGEYLPELDGPGETEGKATLRRLIGHAGVLPELAGDGARPEAAELESAVRDIADARSPGVPGQRFQYVDADYRALARAVEKAAGKPYAAILAERVFMPLGMKSSSGASQFFPPIGAASFFALPLARPAVSSSLGAAAGYVVTTATDAGQYLAFLLGPEKFPRGPVPARVAHSLLEPAVPEATYGYGFRLGEQAGSRAAYRDGSLDGFSSRVALWPDRQTGVVVLAAQSSLLQSTFALPAMISGARRIIQEGSAPRPFPLGRLYILLAVGAAVSVLALVFQTGGALRWTKEIRDKAEAAGTRGPVRFAIFRSILGIVFRALVAALLPALLGLVLGKAVSWPALLLLEPGLAAWCLMICVLGALRNAARLAWLWGPTSLRRLR